MGSRRRLTLAILLITLFCGIDLYSVQRLETIPAEPAATSPFLGDISKFTPQKNHPNLFVEKSSSRKASEYKEMLIEPVRIYIRPKSPLPQINDIQRKNLEDLLRTTLKQQLQKYRKVVEGPGNGVLGIRVAIQDPRPKKNALNKDGTQILEPESELAGGNFEMELVDSESGRRLSACFYQYEKVQDFKKVKDAFLDWSQMVLAQLGIKNK